LSYKTVRHLQTLISGQYDGDYFNLVRQLSPTPALAGMQVNQTMNWLRRNEGYHRGLYGGVIQVENEEEAYAIVLLRCVHWSNTKALGFVGGGIMPTSQNGNGMRR
jgi:isochorismate synthase